MSLVYHANTAGREHWDALWADQQLDRLVAVALRDPMTEVLKAHLPASGPILEAGCGLGQYVLHLRSLGHDVIGGDFSLGALAAHRRAQPDSPLVALDVSRLPFPDGTFQAHICLGVVEHVEYGPRALLDELHRTLAPGGTLLLSVPWVNGMRRVLAPLIRRRQARRRATGAVFYQYAFTRRELWDAVTSADFSVTRFCPYSPARGVRELLSLLRGRGAEGVARATRAAVGRNRGLHGLLRRLLYAPPCLWSFAHMLLVVAEKPALEQ